MNYIRIYRYYRQQTDKSCTLLMHMYIYVACANKILIFGIASLGTIEESTLVTR